MATGRFISDLQAGDSLGSFTDRVSPFIVREFCHAADLHQEVFHGGRDGVQAWPVPLVFVDKLRLFKAACPGGDGPVARVLAECRAEWSAPVRVGDRITVEGRVLNRFMRRERECIEIEVLLRGADDGRQKVRFSDSAVFLSADKPTGTKEARKDTPPAAAAPEGRVFHSAPRRMTPERIRWYCDAQETALENDGKLHFAPPNIHNDEAFAKAQGLPRLIGFGMSSMSWMYGYLLDQYGESYLDRGSLTAKFVRPVFEDQLITTSWREKDHVRAPDGGDAVDLDIWCKDDTGRTLTAGTARIFR